MINKIITWINLKIINFRYMEKIRSCTNISDPLFITSCCNKVFDPIRPGMDVNCNYKNIYKKYEINNLPVWVKFYDDYAWEDVAIAIPYAFKTGLIVPFSTKICDVNTQEDLGYLVMIPKSFESSDELFINFVIYHELGHIYYGDLDNSLKGEYLFDIEKEYLANRYSCEQLNLDVNEAAKYLRKSTEKSLISTSIYLDLHRNKTLSEFEEFIKQMVDYNSWINKQIKNIKKIVY